VIKLAPDKGEEKAEELETSVGEESLAPEELETTQTASPEGDENEPEGAVSEEIPEELPEEPDKQKEAFIKMRQKLAEQERRLKELIEQQQVTQQRDSWLEEIRMGQPNVPPPPPFTPDTPVEEVAQRLTRAEMEAIRARQEAQALRAEMEDKEALEKFPELKTDRDFFEETSALYVKRNLEAAATGKKPITVAEAAEIVKQRWEKAAQSLKAQAAEEATKKLSEKERASLEAKGSSVNIQRSSPKLEELRQKARMGDHSALTELVKLRVLGTEETE